MQKQADGKGEKTKGSDNLTQNALDKIKQDEEDEKKKEVDEAKKEAKYNASKYAAAQANLMKAQGKQLLLAIPFIILGILVLILLITNGGTWVQNGTQFLVGKIRGE